MPRARIRPGAPEPPDPGGRRPAEAPPQRKPPHLIWSSSSAYDDGRSLWMAGVGGAGCRKPASVRGPPSRQTRGPPDRRTAPCCSHASYTSPTIGADHNALHIVIDGLWGCGAHSLARKTSELPCLGEASGPEPCHAATTQSSSSTRPSPMDQRELASRLQGCRGRELVHEHAAQPGHAVVCCTRGGWPTSKKPQPHMSS